MDDGKEHMFIDPFEDAVDLDDVWNKGYRLGVYKGFFAGIFWGAALATLASIILRGWQ
jgi:hypothetical protein